MGLFILWSAVASAAPPTCEPGAGDGQVEVAVLNEFGGPTPWMEVRLAGARTGVHEGRSDARGIATFCVPPGSYEIQTSSTLHGTSRGLARLSVSARTTATVAVTTPRRIETGLSATWQRSALRRLPIGRSLDQVLALTPGVTTGPGGVQVAGSAPDEVRWFVDGVDLTDPVTGGLGWVPAGPVPVLGAHPPLGR